MGVASLFGNQAMTVPPDLHVLFPESYREDSDETSQAKTPQLMITVIQ